MNCRRKLFYSNNLKEIQRDNFGKEHLFDDDRMGRTCSNNFDV